MKNPNLNVNGSVYGAWKTEFGDWMIVTTGDVHCYLLIGSEKALLIDTGYGDGDLRYLVESITKLPVMVVNTHTHLDHSGGNAFWEEVYIGHGGEETAREVESSKRLPYPDYAIHFLEDGEIIDLGDRKIEVLTIGAHHASSLAFLDHKNRTLYSGDELESAQVLLCVSGEDVETEVLVQRHLKNMKKLQARKSEFDRVIPAHNGGPISTDYIDEFIALSEWILSGEAVPQETVAGFGWPANIWGGDATLERIKLGNASFICKK